MVASNQATGPAVSKVDAREVHHDASDTKLVPEKIPGSESANNQKQEKIAAIDVAAQDMSKVEAREVHHDASN